MNKCIVCGNILKGRQIKYCKRGCESAIWRRKNPELNRKYVKTAVKKGHDRRRDYIREQKDKPCTDCGVKYPYYVMQFDHVRGEKKGTVMQLRYYGWTKLLEEIAKCELVCGNCHAERTHKRRLSKG